MVDTAKRRRRNQRNWRCAERCRCCFLADAVGPVIFPPPPAPPGVRARRRTEEGRRLLPAAVVVAAAADEAISGKRGVPPLSSASVGTSERRL
jgi:hypothetical protein